MAILLISIITFLILHISIMGAFAHISHIKVLTISYGIGPTIFKWKIFKVQPIPISGYVAMYDTRDENQEYYNKETAYNLKPIWIQTLLPLSGCITLIIISYIIVGNDAFTSLYEGFAQIVFGALSPLNTAQVYLADIQEFINTNSWLTIIAFVNIKLVTLQLLPLPILNGGQAILNLINQGKPFSKWEKVFFKISIIPAIFIFLSWFIATVNYLW